ncbi:MAG: hypothetical protein KAX33_11865 [Candidatus Lokiarchaeota archaeon]|nr:hypothetical protein [Candidatus Lokiarchaeota archaeon]
MTEYITISARIKKDLKKKIAKYGINISQLMRNAIEAEIERIEESELRKSLRKTGKIFAKIDMETITNLIREDRENR